MPLPKPELLGAIFCVSEVGLALVKRARQKSNGIDRGSLRLLWIVIVVSLAGALLVARRFPQVAVSDRATFSAVGFWIFATGLVLRWASIIYLGQFFTVNVAIASDHRVIDGGPYRFIRHPSYLGALLAFLGLGLGWGNYLSLLVLMLPITLAFIYRIRVEETALLNALGQKYENYAQRTKRLIPFLY